MDETLQQLEKETETKRKQITARKQAEKERVCATTKLKKYSTDKKCEVVEKTNKMLCDTKLRLEQKRIDTALKSETRRSSLYFDACVRVKVNDESDYGQLQGLLLHEDIFSANQGAASIAQIDCGTSHQHMETFAIRAADDKPENGISSHKELEHKKLLVDKRYTKLLTETSEKFKKYETEQMAKLRKFDKEDSKAVALIRKTMESEGFTPEFLVCLDKELAPSQSFLMSSETNK